MRQVLSTLWTLLTNTLMGLNAVAEYGRESAEELRDEARVERAARLKTIEHQE